MAIDAAGAVTGRVCVRLFAELRERAGWHERWLDAHTARTPEQLWAAIAAELAEPPALPARIRVAVNQRFASPATSLAGGDEVAFLPPISGG